MVWAAIILDDRLYSLTILTKASGTQSNQHYHEPYGNINNQTRHKIMCPNTEGSFDELITQEHGVRQAAAQEG
jgi:hypothetical protein